MATKDRVYIDEDLKQLADTLVSRSIPGTTSVQGVFRDTRELAVFAAGLGYRKKRKRESQPQNAKNRREIKLSAIERIEHGGADIIAALAIAETKDVSVLLPSQAVERNEIFERYMNGGLEYISALADERTSPLDLLAKLIKLEHFPEQMNEELCDLLSQRI